MKSISLYWAAAFLLMCCVRLDALQVKVSSIVDAGEHNPFEVRSSIGLNFGGLQHSLSFAMRDESGFEYDTMSILRNQQVKSQLGVERDQFEEISQVWASRRKELTAIVGREIVGASLGTDEIKDLAEEAFLDGEAKMRELLTEDQIEGLEQMRVQLAIEKLGAAAALEASDMRERFGLTESDLETIRERTSGFDEQVAEYRVDELKIANQELLAKARRLASDKANELKELVSESQMEKFLQTPLFTNSDPRKKSRTIKADLTRLAKLKSVRDKIKIADSQFEQITELRAELRENPNDESQTQARLAEILDKDQCCELNRMVVLREMSRMGTVNALAHGFLAKQLGFSKDQANELFEFGVELHDSIKQSVVAKKSELVRKSFADLPQDRRQALMESMRSLNR